MSTTADVVALAEARHWRKHWEDREKELRKKLLQDMLENEQTSLKSAAGPAASLSERLWASVNPDKRAEAVAWLQNNGLEHLTEVKPNTVALSAAVKERYERKQEIPDCIRVSFETTLSLRNNGFKPESATAS